MLNSELFGHAFNHSGVLVPDPAKLGVLDPAISRIELKPLWKTITLFSSFLLKSQSFCPFLEEIDPCPL
jgi:hypothetical protein